jgi:hypothetical protein
MLLQASQLLGRSVLTDVGNKHRRLHRKKKERLKHRALVPGEIGGAGRAPRVEHRAHLPQGGDQALRLLVAARLGDLLVLGELLVDRLEVGEGELGVNGLDVGYRIDVARDVHHVRILEAAHDVGDGVGLADVGEELVAQSLPLGGALHQPGDIDELHHRRHHLLRLGDLGDHLEPQVGHFHDADVGLDGAEGIVLRRDARLGEGIEQGGLADVRQAHDAALHFLPKSDFSRPGFSGCFAADGGGAGSCFFSGAFFGGSSV